MGSGKVDSFLIKELGQLKEYGVEVVDAAIRRVMPCIIMDIYTGKKRKLFPILEYFIGHGLFRTFWKLLRNPDSIPILLPF